MGKRCKLQIVLWRENLKPDVKVGNNSADLHGLYLYGLIYMDYTGKASIRCYLNWDSKDKKSWACEGQREDMVGRGNTIYIITHIYLHIYVNTYIYMHVYMYVCIYVYISSLSKRRTSKNLTGHRARERPVKLGHSYCHEKPQERSLEKGGDRS